MTNFTQHSAIKSPILIFNLSQLQEAEDNYYITAKYILDLSSRAYDLFVSSEVEEKRQLIKLILSNLRLKTKTSSTTRISRLI